jgi:hypothetical protein
MVGSSAKYSGFNNCHLCSNTVWRLRRVCNNGTVFLAICFTAQVIDSSCLCSTQCLCVVVGVVGCFVDGLSAAFVESMLTDCYGANVTVPTAIGCSKAQKYDCTCIYTAEDSSSSSIGDSCVYYSGPALKNGDNCHYIETTWLQNLKAATSFDTIGVILIFALSITSCVSLCYSSSPIHPADVYVAGRATATPAVVIYSAVSNGNSNSNFQAPPGQPTQMMVTSNNNNNNNNNNNVIEMVDSSAINLSGVPMAQAEYVKT